MPATDPSTIVIYTDGSCHTKIKTGAWAAIILYENQKKILTGQALQTTHNQMELMAVIEALNEVINAGIYKQHSNNLVQQNIVVISDSQYVIGLPQRFEKLQANNFLTNAGLPITNIDLVKKLYVLLQKVPVSFEKIKAHQTKTNNANYNREVDMLCRKVMRENVE